MRAIIKLSILFGLAILAVFFLKDNNDVVMLITGDERRTMSLLTASVLLIIAFGVFYVVLRVIVRILAMPKAFSRWSEKRHESKDIALLERGWIELLEGSSDKAEKDLLRLVDHTHDNKRHVLASMAAARAAHDLDHFDRRDSLLADARQCSKHSPRLEAAVATLHAELLLEQGNGGAALTHLDFVKTINNKSIHVQELLLRAYRQTGQTIKMIEVARQLNRKNIVSDEELATLVEHYGAIYIANTSFDEANAFYQSLSRAEQAVPTIALAMASRCDQLEDYRKAGQALEAGLNHKLDSRLLAQYVKCPEVEVKTRLAQAQKWLERDENNAELLIVLGQFCLMSKLWGQAERYLNKSLSIQENTKAYALLGILNDTQGRSQEAIRHWRMASSTTVALAVPESVNILAAADTSNDPVAPPDVKNLDNPNDHLLSNQLETGHGIIENKDEHEFFDAAPVTTVSSNKD